MSRYGKGYGIKKLYIWDFSVWDCDDDPNLIDKVINNAIDSSEGVYIYRSYSHSFEENDLIKWLKNEKEIINYKEVLLEFVLDNITENFLPKNNELVYYLELNKEKKEDFLKYFKLSIRAIRNRIGEKKLIQYLEKSIYVDDPTYDQYDFIFTIGDRVMLFTDIHDFSFVNEEM